MNKIANFNGKKKITDLEKFKELLDSLAVEYKVETKYNYIDVESGHLLNNTDVILLTLTQGDKKVVGWLDFYTEIVFDLDGKFIRIGAYE